ncbi:MAG: cysteine hydrolase [Gemmatimonadota bacterium]|nr:cysteine hydrolase [Gemmatimonadota bacterium]
MSSSEFQPNIAALIVDVQVAAVTEGLYQGETALANMAEVIKACRKNRVEVIFVQHEDAEGDYVRHSEGWLIHPAVAPQPSETIIHKKFNSAFRGTDLRSYLDQRNIETLILMGLHTEYCFDTTCRVAFEYGFSILIPELTNTTADNGPLKGKDIYEFYNHRIFDGRFAKLLPVNEIIEDIRGENYP